MTRVDARKIIANSIKWGGSESGVPYNTFKTWKRRIITGEITMDKIRYVLSRLGYKRTAREIWENSKGEKIII